MADHRTRDGVKFSAVNQGIVAQGQMDMTGFRIGKTRLVSRKKKKSNLKKVILEEREDRRTTGELPAAGAPGPAPGRGASTSGGLSVDAPEFVPLGWLGGAFAELAARADASSPAVPAAPLAGAAVVQDTDGSGAEGGEEGNPSADGLAGAGGLPAPAAPAPSSGSPVAGEGASAPIFVPSWCQGQPSAEHAAAQVAEQPGDGGGDELPVAEALERLCRLQEGRGKAPERKEVKKAARGADLEVRHYVHQVLSDELDDKVKGMLGELARFQERAKERDPLKYQKQKRFCVGMREASRSVARGKAKCIVCAPNLEECSAEGGLDETMEDLIEACREGDVPVVFALSRNRIGKALGKNIRLSIVCILSAEGVHQELKQVIRLTDDLRRQWVVRQMAHFTSEDAEEARRRAEEKAARDKERREEKAKLEAERKAEEERQRAEAKAAKEAEKARKAAERQADLERRRAAKAVREQAAKEADADAEVVRREAERKAEEERRRAAEQAAKEKVERAKREAERRAEEEKRKAAEQAARKAAPVEEDAGEESDSSGSSVPLGFNSALF